MARLRNPTWQAIRLDLGIISLPQAFAEDRADNRAMYGSQPALLLMTLDKIPYPQLHTYLHINFGVG